MFSLPPVKLSVVVVESSLQLVDVFFELDVSLVVIILLTGAGAKEGISEAFSQSLKSAISPLAHNLPRSLPSSRIWPGFVEDTAQYWGRLLFSLLSSILLFRRPALIFLLLAILKLYHIGLFASTWVLLLRNQFIFSLPALLFAGCYKARWYFWLSTTISWSHGNQSLEWHSLPSMNFKCTLRQYWLTQTGYLAI